MKLKSAVELFLNRIDNTGTKKAYKQATTYLMKYLGTDRALASIDAETFQKIFWIPLLEDHNTWSIATRRKHIKSLRALFNLCIAQGYISINPAHIVKLPSINAAVPRDRAISEIEYERLLEYARFTSPRNYALLLFLADTGCRAIAAAGLRLEDIDLTSKSAWITGKGDKSRTVYFGDECRIALQNWLRMKKKKSGAYVFRERPGDKPIKPAAISQAVWRLAKTCGIDHPVGSHRFRHRLGHRLADAHVPPSVAQNALGHTDVRTTLDHYYPNDDERVREAVQSLATRKQEQPKVIQLFKEGRK